MHVLRRIDPTPEQLRETLDEAFRRGVQTLDGGAGLEPPPWTTLEEQAAEMPEGVFSRPYHLDWQRGRLQFLAAWWSDAMGRRHWHIGCSAMTGFPPGEALAEMSWGPAPECEDHPLSHVAPPLSFLWKVNGRNREPFVVCRCGFAGTPASLAWMGDTCGPCFDREQEGLPPLGIDPWRRDLGPFDHFIVAPDGRLVTLRFEGATVVVRVWVPPYVGKPIWRREWSDSSGWAVACNKRHLALLLAGRLTLVNLDDGRTSDSRAMPELAEPEVIPIALAFAGMEGGRLLARCDGMLTAWGIGEDGKIGERLFQVTTNPFWALAVSHLGQRVLSAEQIVRETATGNEIERLDFAGRILRSAAYTRDGAIIATGVTPTKSPTGPTCELVRWEAEGRPTWTSVWGWLLGRKPRKPSRSQAEEMLNAAVAVGADGTGLAVFDEVSSPVRLVLADAKTLAPQAAFTLAESRRRLVDFSPNGRDLLFLTDHGLAVYPWRELIGQRL